MTLQAMVKHIELWLFDRLIPYARNPRTHSNAQVAQIAASIAAFGFNNPILVEHEGRHYRRPRPTPCRAKAGAHRGSGHNSGSS
jgi:hypothetical protein